ncbi:MAG: hypothetical protein ACTSVI_05520 [Promethearchaeota archaeon]
MIKINQGKIKYRKVIALVNFIIIIISTTVITPSILFNSFQLIDQSKFDFPTNLTYQAITNYTIQPPPVRKEGFLFQVQQLNYSPFFFDIVNRSVHKYGLGETTIVNENGTNLGEWGYSFFFLINGMVDGSGQASFGGYTSDPKNRQDALNMIRNYLMKRMENKSRPWGSFNGHFLFHHYAGEWGFDLIGSEIGENINNYQIHVAFNRGAAKQYYKPWFIDVSAWHGPGITDYSNSKPWAEMSCDTCGHSLSLYNRTYFMSYMSGASAIIAEAGGVNFFLEEKDQDGDFLPSPLGMIGKNFYNFTCRHEDPGIPYVPFGILLDHEHGTYPGFGHKRAFNYFLYNKGDEMTWKLFNFIFPHGWTVSKEKGTLVNTDFGDTFDVILQTASLNTLKSYPVLIPSGGISFSEQEINNIIAYTKAGGILILNDVYSSQFPAEFTGGKNTCGIQVQPVEKGLVVKYGPDYEIEALHLIMKNLREKLIPFKISDNIEFLVNRREKSWVLTLINNDGIIKSPRVPPTIDETKEKHLEIQYTGPGRLSSINDWDSDANIWDGKNPLQVTIGPGSLKVLEFMVET